MRRVEPVLTGGIVDHATSRPAAHDMSTPNRRYSCSNPARNQRPRACTDGRSRADSAGGPIASRRAGIADGATGVAGASRERTERHHIRTAPNDGVQARSDKPERHL